MLQLLQEWSDKLADMVLAPSVAGLFKWRQFGPEVILLAVGWYMRFLALVSRRRGTLGRAGPPRRFTSPSGGLVQRYAPELQRCLRHHLKPTNDSWRLDETYIRVKGKWRYLYRAVDSSGANHPAPRVINTDGHAAYPSAVAQLKAGGALAEDCRHRPAPYLNNVLEQDHRAIKRRVNARQHFRSFWGFT